MGKAKTIIWLSFFSMITAAVLPVVWSYYTRLEARGYMVDNKVYMWLEAICWVLVPTLFYLGRAVFKGHCPEAHHLKDFFLEEESNVVPIPVKQEQEKRKAS